MHVFQQITKKTVQKAHLQAKFVSAVVHLKLKSLSKFDLEISLGLLTQSHSRWEPAA